MSIQKTIFDEVSLSCSKITTKSYSTSFSLAIKLLNKEYRNAIYSVYGFVRLADEIVDSFHGYNKKQLLSELRYSTIEALEKKISLNPIINSFQKTVKQYNIEWHLIDSFLESMEYDLDNNKCSEKTYKKYIAGSAEAVGLMCLQIFSKNGSIRYQDLEKYARSLGAAFQKINFLRDLKDDYKNLNRIYFPDLDINNLTEKDKKLIEDDIKKDFEHAIIGIKLLNKEAKKGVFLAYKYYICLFKKIQNTSPEKILKKRIRVSNLRKIFILIYSQIRFLI